MNEQSRKSSKSMESKSQKKTKKRIGIDDTENEWSLPEVEEFNSDEDF